MHRFRRPKRLSKTKGQPPVLADFGRAAFGHALSKADIRWLPLSARTNCSDWPLAGRWDLPPAVSMGFVKSPVLNVNAIDQRLPIAAVLP